MMFEILIGIITFFIGASFGSFLNVVVERFVRGNKPVTGRSACPQCQRTLRWYELLPVISYILQGGRCRSCRYHIPAQYLLMEVLCGVAALYLFWQVMNGTISTITGGATASIFCLLLVLFMIDLKTFYLPDLYILLLSGIALVWAFFEQPHSWQSMIEGASLGAGFLLSCGQNSSKNAAPVR